VEILYQDKSVLWTEAFVSKDFIEFIAGLKSSQDIKIDNVALIKLDETDEATIENFSSVAVNISVSNKSQLGQEAWLYGKTNVSYSAVFCSIIALNPDGCYCIDESPVLKKWNGSFIIFNMYF
jgi:hypothetical protein